MHKCGSFSEPWLTEEKVQQAAKDSDWFIIGNEWTLADWPLASQVSMIRKMVELIHGSNPACNIVGTNDVMRCPQQGIAGYRRIREVANRYAQLYGHVPPFRGLGFHAYQFDNDLAYDIRATVWEARRVYGADILPVLTETAGNMPALASVRHYLHAYFWYVSYVPGCPSNLFHADGSLTATGRAYREL
jgi:hypothetical protein